ncbi:MAG: rod shape-determining protein RodA [bacterium]|nr:rod shape-determining protein RodA [bacterium]
MHSRIELRIPFYVLLLSLIGGTVLYSAGYDVETATSPRFVKQLYYFVLGFLFFGACLFIPADFWRRAAYPAYAGGIATLLMVLAVGKVAGGARRWIAIGGFTVQPSEFTKVLMVLALARVLADFKGAKDGYNLWQLWKPALVVLLPLGLIVLQPDLGTGLCHVLIAGVMVLVAGVRKKTILFVLGLVAVAAYPAWHSLHDYQQQRVFNFLSPERDPLGTGYHAIQSKIAVGSGGLYGKGYMQGTQTQLRFLPEQTTDFIFSVFSEEWGFVGTSVLIALYALLVTRILNLAAQSEDRFTSFVCVGMAAMVFWHVVVNIGMATGVLPVVGLTLPWMSYGGSSVLAMLAGMGVLAGVVSRPGKRIGLHSRR